jgi:hypothetical protein
MKSPAAASFFSTFTVISDRSRGCGAAPMKTYLVKGLILALVYPFACVFLLIPLAGFTEEYFQFNLLEIVIRETLMCVVYLPWPAGVLVDNDIANQMLHFNKGFANGGLWKFSLSILLNAMMYCVAAALLWIGDHKSQFAYILVGFVVITAWFFPLLKYLPHVSEILTFEMARFFFYLDGLRIHE